MGREKAGRSWLWKTRTKPNVGEAAPSMFFVPIRLLPFFFIFLYVVVFFVVCACVCVCVCFATAVPSSSRRQKESLDYCIAV